MHLALKNFRSHANTECTFPDKGFVKISGPSGIGKSNLLKAISWVLFGDMRNVQRYGSDTCMVTLEMNGVKVVRGKDPTVFLVNDTLSGEQAQEHVVTTLEMNALEFEVSSYIAQDQVNSFIHCKPTEQMELLQRLAFHKDNPEEEKSRAKAFLAETEKEALEVASQLKVGSHGIEMKTAEVARLKEAVDRDQPTEPSEVIDELEEWLQKIQKTGAETKQRIFAAEKSLKDPLRERVAKAQAYLETALPQQAVFAEWFAANPEEKFAQAVEMEEANHLSIHLKAQMLEYQAMQSRAADRNGCERKVMTYRSQLWDAVTAAYQQGADCVSASAEPLSKIATKLLSAETDLAAAKGHPTAFLDDPETAFHEATERLKQLKEIHSAWIGVQAVRADKKKAALELNINIDKANRVVEQAASLPRQDVLEAELTLNRDAFALLESEANDLESRIKRQSAINAMWRTWHGMKSQLEMAELNLHLLSKKQREEQQKLDRLNNRVGKWKRYLELVQRAALTALDERIQEINFRAEHWLDVLFGGMLQATIETEKESKNGNVSHKINLSIYENGVKIGDKKELSGGQQSRLALAFQLALSDLYRSPVLLLDESLKGCDPETQKICLEAIRQISERKLVLMVEHHVADSQFDHVVEI